MVENKRTIFGATTFETVLMAYRDHMETSANGEARLSGVIAETLANPGRLTRAQLAYKVGVGNGLSPHRAATLGSVVEYFHTASLLLDDLPCMDDASMRRGRACAHTKFGEAAAILGALAFINRAYALVWRELGSLPENCRGPAADLLESCLGAGGVLLGQSKDVHFAGTARDERTVSEIAIQKTVTMIRLALVFPALAAGVGDTEIELLESLSHWWGLAYQLLDDLKDVLHDESSGKTAGRDQLLNRPNMVLCIGRLEAWSRLDAHLNRAATALDELVRLSKGWSFLERLQGELISERARLECNAEAA